MKKKESKCVPTREEIDEALDLMAFGGLVPIRPKYNINLRGMIAYAEKQGKDLSELTMEEVIPFHTPL